MFTNFNKITKKNEIGLIDIFPSGIAKENNKNSDLFGLTAFWNVP